MSRAVESLRELGVVERLIGLRRSPRSYSQYGEDVFIRSYYSRLRVKRGITVATGTIVDVGCYRPVRLSNTFLFYKAGWKSINIDPAPEAKALFDKVRPRDTNLRMAIAERAGEATLYYFGKQSVYNTLSKDTALAASSQIGVAPQEIRVPLARLDAIMNQYVSPKELEIVMIDAEGLDLIILQTNDWDAYRPRVILIEVHGADLLNLNADPVVKFMLQKDYVLFAANTPNMMFVRADSVV